MIDVTEVEIGIWVCSRIPPCTSVQAHRPHESRKMELGRFGALGVHHFDDASEIQL
jgi:hypothetical protein